MCLSHGRGIRLLRGINQKRKHMTRREVLRHLGKTAISVTLSSMGISAFTSCSEKGKKRLVFYFTATGNSLYTALQFSDTPLSIPQVMKNDNLVFEADEIGLVFPDYQAKAPEMVKRFLEKATLKAPYLFSVITYGAWACNVVEYWNKFALDHGVRFNYIDTILMVDNWLPSFDMEAELKIDKKEEEQLRRIVADITEEKDYIPVLSDEERARCEAVLQRLTGLFPVRSETLFNVDKDRCVGCGFCTRVCPSGCVSLTSTGVTYEGNCEYCLACVHNCPQKAITLKNGERNPEARYRHPNISINQIVRANIQ